MPELRCVTHELKTDKDVFNLSWNNRKAFEIRLDDRGYQVGDELVLRETEHSGRRMREPEGLSIGELMPLIYTGRRIRLEVVSIVKNYGLVDGWVVMGVKEVYRIDDLA